MAPRLHIPLALCLAVGGCQCYSLRDERVGGLGRVPDAGDSGPADGTMALARFEVCNNGIDDDQNGFADDGCTCAPGSTQPCYPGWPAFAGVGTCSLGVQTCVASGSTGRWERCEGAVLPVIETCGDGLDDDCDGLFDEDCPCEPGATRSCFAGDPRQVGVGPCTPGITTCIEMDVFEGSSRWGWGPCEGAVGSSTEVCNGVDDDCDGVDDDIPEICDLIDNDCDGETDEGEACSALPPAFALSRYWPPTGSGLLPPTVPLFALEVVAPEASVCAAGEVLIDVGEGRLRCVPAPPTDCRPGTRADWTGGAWECVVCDLMVQFGGLFAFERACAPAPALTCPADQVPTFRAPSHAWECIPTCANGDYDRAFYEGMLVCIPC